MHGSPEPTRQRLIELPSGLRATLYDALVALGRSGDIVGAEPLSGGCINHATRLRTRDGEAYVLKWNPRAPAGFFAAEAEGLHTLRAACTAGAADLRVPEPLAWSADPERDMGGAEGGRRPLPWLLLEMVPRGRPTPASADRLGRGLAALHDAGRSLPPHAFGWPTDNFIGSLPQPNGPLDSWTEFWRTRRIAPQLERARRSGHLRSDSLDRVLDRMDVALASVAVPDLLHGDLWGGNVFFDAEGTPVLVDPAVHLGHGEVDLAMSELFGGFDDRMRVAYHERREEDPAYDAYRRDLYQLYYLLVHVNLFGAGYEAPTRAAAERVLAALG